MSPNQTPALSGKCPFAGIRMLLAFLGDVCFVSATSIYQPIGSAPTIFRSKIPVNAPIEL
jgi:hypothetical protein